MHCFNKCNTPRSQMYYKARYRRDNHLTQFFQQYCVQKDAHMDIWHADLDRDRHTQFQATK